jgi:hypothetical protein
MMRLLSLSVVFGGLLAGHVRADGFMEAGRAFSASMYENGDVMKQIMEKKMVTIQS